MQWGCAAGTSAKWRGTVPLCCWCVIRDKCEVERNVPLCCWCVIGDKCEVERKVPLCCWCVIGFIFRYLNHRLRIQHARRASTRQIRRRSRLRQSQRRRHRDACCCGRLSSLSFAREASIYGIIFSRPKVNKALHINYSNRNTHKTSCKP